jgi:hypothetical protein
MRYSRFKKQMDGTSAVRKPRNPSSSPRKPKVEKNKSPKKIKERKPSDDDRIKAEAGESQDTQIEGTPEAGTPIDSHHGSPAHIVKRGPGLPSGYPLTPMGSLSQSHSPSPGLGEMGDMDEMMASFGMPGHGMPGEQALYHHHHQGVGVMVDADPRHGYGMGMHMEMADPFEGPWYQQAHAQGQEEGHAGVLVKTEPRWEEAYRQV